MRSDHPVRQMLVIGVIASAIGIAIGLTIDWFPTQASSQAKQISRLYDVLIVATVPVFVLVATVVLYSVYRFRMRPGEESRDGPPLHGNTRLEIIWTAAPSVLIIGLVAYALVVLHDIEKKPAGPEMQVNVTGQQFAWSYQYPASVTGGKPLASSVLYLPKGESVNFNMKSLDVIHAFWVPSFSVQLDVVPGITTHYRVTPTRIGTYDVVCNELCGLGHSVMRSSVHVVEPAAFKRWLAGQQQAAGGPAPGAGGGGAPAAGNAGGGAAPAASGARAASGTRAPAAAGARVPGERHVPQPRQYAVQSTARRAGRVPAESDDPTRVEATV